MSQSADINSEFLTASKRDQLESADAPWAGAEAVGRVARDFVEEIDRRIADVQRLVSGIQGLTDEQDPRAAGLQAALQQATHATEVAQQFLSFSRSRLDASYGIDLEETLDSVRPILELLTGESIRLTIEVETGRCVVHAVREGFARILAGLVADGAEALPVGGAIGIRVTAGTVPGVIVLTVRPTGFGLKPLREPDHGVAASWGAGLRMVRDHQQFAYELTLRAASDRG
jgi:hypothetical protein